MPGVMGSDHGAPCVPHPDGDSGPPGATGWSPRLPHHADVRHRRPRGPRRERPRASSAASRRAWRARSSTGVPTTPGCGRTPPPVSPWPIAAWRSSEGAHRDASPCAPAPGSSITTVSSTTRRSCAGARGRRRRHTGNIGHRGPRPRPRHVGPGRDAAPRRRHVRLRRLGRSHARALHLVRDRFGEKPLFYGWVGPRFVFASELKAFHTLAGFGPSIDTAAVASFLQFSCVPAPQCIYDGFAKLRPGSLVTLTGATAPGTLPEQRPYWSAEAAIADAGRLTLLEDDREAEETVEAALSGAVAARMVADVPVGALLSGGIDSSLIVALMQRHSTRPVRTFTVAFAEQSFDESVAAAAVATTPGHRPRHRRVALTRGARTRPPAGGDLGRAVRRQLAAPDPSRRRGRSALGDGRPVR